MTVKPRYQNPTVGDSVLLSLYAYNNNAYGDFTSIDRIEIWHHDPSVATEENPNGSRLVETIAGSRVEHPSVGNYSFTLPLTDPKYVLGEYEDRWWVSLAGEAFEPVENHFKVYPNLWFTTPTPIVYDFSFAFRPNKIRVGSKKYLIVDVTPNVPKASDLARYYEQLAIVSPVTINMEMACVECQPEGRDLRVVLEDEPVGLRDGRVGYYLLDTSEMKPGIYDVWFGLNLGETVHLSERQQLQIHE